MSNIYLWYGPDDYTLKQTLITWQNQFKQKYSSYNIYSLDLKEEELKIQDLVSKLKSALLSDSLFGETKLVVLENFLGVLKSSYRDEIYRYLVKSLERLSSSLFLIFIEKEKPEKENSLYKKIGDLSKKNKATIREFVLPVGSKFTQWAFQKIQEKGAKIEKEALELLAQYLGNDFNEARRNKGIFNLWEAHNEIIKLVNYKKKDWITVKDIKLLLSPKENQDIFALLNALMSKNTPKALEIAHHLIEVKEPGKNEKGKVLYILNMIFWQIHHLLVLKDLLSYKKSTEEICSELKWTRGRFWINNQLSQNFTKEELKNIYQRLLSLDIEIKTRQESPLLSLDLLIYGICQAPA